MMNNTIGSDWLFRPDVNFT